MRDRSSAGMSTILLCERSSSCHAESQFSVCADADFLQKWSVRGTHNRRTRGCRQSCCARDPAPAGVANSIRPPNQMRILDRVLIQVSSEMRVVTFCCSLGRSGSQCGTTPAPATSRVDARQSQKSIPRSYRGSDVKSPFPLPLT